MINTYVSAVCGSSDYLFVYAFEYKSFSFYWFIDYAFQAELLCIVHMMDCGF